MQRMCHRPVDVFLTIDATLAGALAVICSARSASFRRSRRILANVLFRSVLKLGLYRNEGSRIDFMKPRNRVAQFRIHRYGSERRYAISQLKS